jgi:hypothetical protein
MARRMPSSDREDSDPGVRLRLDAARRLRQGAHVLMPEEVNVVMLLDLAVENPIDASVVLAQMPPGSAAPTVLRVTDFGVAPRGTGTPDDWPAVIAAIDGMVSKARSAERGGARVRYWVAGRAGLPAFVHLGYRLTKKAVVTLVNPRDSGLPDVLWLDRASSSGDATTRYFVSSPRPARASLANVRVNLLVSSRIQISPAQIEAQIPDRGTASPIVEAQASSFLDETSVAAALRELDDTMVGIRSSYPGCGALAMFIAGPAILAFLVGRSINPHIFPDIQVFQHRSNQYQLAYETQPPTPPTKKHTILFLASNPVGTDELALADEARAIQEAIDRSSHLGHLAFETRWAAQPQDLLRELRKLKPTVVHFCGHGSANGLFFQAVDGLPSVVSGDAIAKTFDAVEAPLQLVVLNACYSESQAKELQAHVACIIGMTAQIGDESSRHFAIGFYGGLAHGASVASAYKQGCAAIALEGPALADRDQPKLIVRDGVDASKITLT